MELIAEVGDGDLVDEVAFEDDLLPKNWSRWYESL
jgi:hypothetical protein